MSLVGLFTDLITSELEDNNMWAGRVGESISDGDPTDVGHVAEEAEVFINDLVVFLEGVEMMA